MTSMVQQLPSEAVVSVAPFAVFVRPMGNAWKIRVAGSAEATWLRDQLVARELDCTDPVPAGPTDHMSFRCMSVTHCERDYVWRLLKQLPEVLLQNSPA